MEAKVLVMKCSKTNELFGVRIQKMEDNDWHRTWAFRLNEQQVQHERYNSFTVNGSLKKTKDFPGCPYCGRQGFAICGYCKKVFCWNGKQHTCRCPWCNNTSHIKVVNHFSVRTNEL